MKKAYFVGSDFFYNKFSQYGEDGIIKKVLADLDLQVKVACEFGAWDGKHCSNTYALKDLPVDLVMIEGDAEKYKFLLATKKTTPNIIPINCYVEPSGSNSLDNILIKYKIKTIDFLSIDIDGYDLLILKKMEISPKLVIVEFNPTFGVFKEYESSEGESSGNSFMSTYRIMREKGYSLVSYTKTNLIFVLRNILESAGYIELDITSLSYLAEIDSAVYQISSAYDGRSIEFGKPTNPWDGCRLAKRYKHPNFIYGWPPTRLQVAYRAMRTLSVKEIYSGLKKAIDRGWFKF
jgi:hypothetical protein